MARRRSSKQLPEKMTDEESAERARETLRQLRHHYRATLDSGREWRPDSDGQTADWPKTNAQ